MIKIVTKEKLDFAKRLGEKVGIPISDDIREDVLDLFLDIYVGRLALMKLLEDTCESV